MFPEDYFNNISLFAMYGVSNAYKIYNDLNSYTLNQPFYINSGQKFINSSFYQDNRELFSIGISCEKEKLSDYAWSICYKNTNYSFVFDGFIQNKNELIKKLEDRGVILQNYGDVIIFASLFLKAQGDTDEKIEQIKNIVKGSYNFLIKYDDYIIAGCHNQVKKSMIVGRLDTGTIIISDNHDYFYHFDVELIKELSDGEVITLYDNQILSNFTENKVTKRCALNYIYKSNVNSKINHVNIIDLKTMLVRYLKEIDVDIVVHYPTQPLTYAYEYANINNMSFKEIAYINNNHITYVDQHIKDMRIVVVNENLCQVKEIKAYIENLYKRGALEVHLKVLSPMLNYECPYYMNQSHSFDMIFNEVGIKEYLNVSSIEFISDVNFMLSIRKLDKTSHICLKCINK